MNLELIMQNKNVLFLKIQFKMLRNTNIILTTAAYPNYVSQHTKFVFTLKNMKSK